MLELEDDSSVKQACQQTARKNCASATMAPTPDFPAYTMNGMIAFVEPAYAA